MGADDRMIWCRLDRGSGDTGGQGGRDTDTSATLLRNTLINGAKPESDSGEGSLAGPGFR